MEILGTLADSLVLLLASLAEQFVALEGGEQVNATIDTLNMSRDFDSER